jgi:hypothetical protein
VTHDNWANRGATMRCETCMFFVLKKSGEDVNPANSLGRCRRHAPTLGGWPAVWKSDWCGDHKLDEEKI